MILEKRPDQIEAIKFEGGAENAQEVAEWIKTRLARHDVSWQMPILNDGDVVVSEELRISLHGNYHVDVAPGEWFVIEPGDLPSTYPTTEFNLFAQYKEVSDGGGSQPS